MFTIADTREEALERRRKIVTYDKNEFAQRLQYLSAMVGIDLTNSAIDIKQALPESIKGRLRASWMDPRAPRAVELLQEGYSPLDTIAKGVINYHPVVVGTAEDVADFLEEWFLSGSTDGFSIVPDLSHDGVEAFVEKVAPILQGRGLFHKEYEGTTLRKNIVLPYQYGLKS